MSLMTALAMPADENKQYQYYAECVSVTSLPAYALRLIFLRNPEQAPAGMPSQHPRQLPADAVVWWRRGKHILICIIKALIYLHAYNVAHLVSCLLSMLCHCACTHASLLSCF